MEALDNTQYAFNESLHDAEALQNTGTGVNTGGPGIFNASGKVMNERFSFVTEVRFSFVC